MILCGSPMIEISTKRSSVYRTICNKMSEISRVAFCCQQLRVVCLHSNIGEYTSDGLGPTDIVLVKQSRDVNRVDGIRDIRSKEKKVKFFWEETTTVKAVRTRVDRSGVVLGERNRAPSKQKLKYFKSAGEVLPTDRWKFEMYISQPFQLLVSILIVKTDWSA